VLDELTGRFGIDLGDADLSALAARVVEVLDS
jgi:arylamine N-acetyltransferase